MVNLVNQVGPGSENGLNRFGLTFGDQWRWSQGSGSDLKVWRRLQGQDPLGDRSSGMDCKYLKVLQPLDFNPIFEQLKSPKRTQDSIRTRNIKVVKGTFIIKDLMLINNNLEASRVCLSSYLFVVAVRLRCFAGGVEIARVASGSFVAVRLRSFDDFPFLSDRKLRHFDRKQQRELAGCEESEHGILKSVELRLLRCTISGDLPLPSCSPYPNPENTLDPLTYDVLGAIERGDYAAALSSDAARLVFSFANSWEFDDSSASAALFYSQVERSIDAFLCDGASEEPWVRVLDARVDANTEYRVAVVLCLGVAALLAFLQQNYLEHAKVILLKIKDFCTNSAKTTSWWLCRLFLLQQRILDDLSSSLYNLLQVFKNEALLQFGEVKDVVKYWGAVLHEKEALAIASMLQVEAGIIEYHYGRIDSSRLHFARAAETSGTDLSVTGVLGYRTIHQVDAKPQLVLVANTGQKAKGNASLESFSREKNVSQEILDRQERSDALDINIIHRGKDVGRTTGLSRVQSDKHSCKNRLDFKSNGHYECDILMAPRLIQDATTVGANGEFAIIGKDVMLTSIQQAIILSQCLHLQRTKRDDELSSRLPSSEMVLMSFYFSRSCHHIYILLINSLFFINHTINIILECVCLWMDFFVPGGELSFFTKARFCR
ncbi:hypothetical protein IEQ34_010990 [Dendrobium chrysotoxum]|uniref:Uncharacterized protein n=1 Tax=Dendrobium chrysotoxum TaxID=161865 RepID=A0AAV7GWF7_DENCH|nr:hypothetical protein IEQ34_010990 [Dendrobium chrysotoxum]